MKSSHALEQGGFKKNEKGDIIPRPLVVVFKSDEVANFWHNGGKGFKCGVHWINEDLCRADREAIFVVVWDQRRKRQEQREQHIQRREQQSKQSQLTKQ